MKKYELTPTDRKSFYGKAIVEIDDNGNETLYSYGTPIIRKANGKLVRLWDSTVNGEYAKSPTTSRHIKAFCGISRKEFEKMEVEK